jgi:probable rRNA maturation factor
MSPGSSSGPSRLAPVAFSSRSRAPGILFAKATALFRLNSADKRSIRDFARVLDQRVAGGRGFDCLLADDAELMRLNREFLRHDYPTDVLSFPSGAPSGSLGDMAISLERAAAQASEFGHSILDEIRILLLHGVLHLTGMDHECDGGRMARAERTWRVEFNLPEALLSRSERVKRPQAKTSAR